MTYETIQEVRAAIALATGRSEHRVAIVLRSGLGSYAGGLPGADEIPYSEISGFPVPKVEGHILAR